MDNITQHKKPSSGDSFSFPSTPTPDSADFEFGSLTPDSPSAEPFATSPADHLFLNGRLRPHLFPLPTTSRTSSTRDSLLSSRSNSTNSSCSSARTSSSDSSERKSFHSKLKGGSLRAKGSTPSHCQAYGCSQRWQYITPVPALSREGSVRRRKDTKQGKKEERTKRKHNNNNKKNKKESTGNNKGVRLRFGRRILRWFVMACRECHAMEPSSKGRNNKEM